MPGFFMTVCTTRGFWMLFMTENQSNTAPDIVIRNIHEEYIELHTSSAFSFLAGSSDPDSYVQRAIEIGMPAMALADRNGLYGAARFHTSAKHTGVKAHIGAEVAVSSIGKRLVPPDCSSA